MKNATKQSLLDRVEADRDVMIDFLRGFIRCKSPISPGDATEVAAYVRAFLDRHGLVHRVISPHQPMPNIVATFDAASLGGISRSMATWMCPRSIRQVGLSTPGAAN